MQTKWNEELNRRAYIAVYNELGASAADLRERSEDETLHHETQEVLERAANIITNYQNQVAVELAHIPHPLDYLTD